MRVGIPDYDGRQKNVDRKRRQGSDGPPFGDLPGLWLSPFSVVIFLSSFLVRSPLAGHGRRGRGRPTLAWVTAFRSNGKHIERFDLINAERVMNTAPTPLPDDRIQIKLKEIALRLPALPPWYDALSRLSPASTDEERWAARDGGVLPPDAGFYLVADQIDELVSRLPQPKLLEFEDQMQAV